MVERLADVRVHRDYFRLGAVPTVVISIVTTALMALRVGHPTLVVNVTSGLSGALQTETLPGAGACSARVVGHGIKFVSDFD